MARRRGWDEWWAAEWRSRNRLDGETKHWICERIPNEHGRHIPHLFPTRQACRDFIEQDFGFIRDRLDLQREPHGWMMPVPVKVRLVLVPVE